MRILIYNWKDLKHPDVGGAEIITWELARRLVKDGNRVTWFCRSFKGAKPAETIDGVKVVRQGGLLSTYIYGWRYYRALERKPDVVIDMLNTILWQTPLYARESVRLCYVNQLAKEVFTFELPKFLSPVAKLLERLQFLTYKRTKSVVYSPSTKADLTTMGIPLTNIYQFALGVDHARYRPGRKAPYPLFVAVNRLAKMKRTDLTIRAMQTVVKRYPRARFVIMGYGPELEPLQQLITTLGLQKNVQILTKDVLFFKREPKDRKVALMQQAWALVLPSVKEGWGMVVTEAAGCGTPAIVTDVTGLRDSVRKDRTGLIVSTNPTPNELGKAMLKLIKQPALRTKLGKTARQWARQFHWAQTYRQFHTALERAMRGEEPNDLPVFKW